MKKIEIVKKPIGLFCIIKQKIISRSNNFYLQNKLLRNMLKYATNNTEYYKIIKSNKLEDFPVISKQEIKNNFDKFVSNKKELYFYRESKTGGSTGEPFFFYNQMYADKNYQLKYWKKLGYKRGDKILSLTGSSFNKKDVESNIIIKKVKHSSYGDYVMSSLYLNEFNIKNYVTELIKLKPSFIRGYPSFVYELSKYILNEKVFIEFDIKAIQLTSEIAMEYQIDSIRKAFNTKVFYQYGHTECCVFGYTLNEEEKYYIEPLYGKVEILDENNKNVREGEIGEVVVTSYYNFVMPLIRYRTGDLAEFGGYDKENRMILNKIFGRTQDFVYDKNNQKICLTSLIFAQHFEAMKNIEKWQIEQFYPGTIIIHLVKSNNYSITDEIEIKNLFYKISNFNIIFDYLDDIEKTNRGKTLMLKQHIQN